MGENLTHQGHRDRLRQQIIKNGMDEIPVHNILEFLLFHTVPRKDVNELAHTLIDRFGSFSGVLDASFEELLNAPGVSKTTAALISAMPGVFRRYQREKTRNGCIFSDLEQIGEHIIHWFVGRTLETVVLLCLDLKNQLIDERPIAVGTVGNVRLPVRTIVEVALNLNAARVVIGHNHPGGVAIPSAEDITVTVKIQDMLSMIGIELIDHIVVTEDDYVSMRSSNMLSG